MIGTCIVQKYQINCDHCGKSPGHEEFWFDTVQEAMEAARAVGYVINQWRFQGDHGGQGIREYHLCPECYAKVGTQYQGKAPVEYGT